MLDALDKAGLRENTVVMLKSDHGIAVPFAKTNCWRHSTITPWLVRWPGVVKAGSFDSKHIITGIDLAPTVLDILDVPNMQGVDGQSFLPALQGADADGFDHAYTQINSLSSGKSFAMRSYQDKRYGFIWNGWADGKTKFRNESMFGLTWNALRKAGETDAAIKVRADHYEYRCQFEFL